MRRCWRIIASLLPIAERASPGVTPITFMSTCSLHVGSHFRYNGNYARQTEEEGRPATGVDQLSGVQIPDSLVLAVDRWAAENNSPSRSDAMRRLLELGLWFSKKPPKVKR